MLTLARKQNDFALRHICKLEGGVSETAGGRMTGACFLLLPIFFLTVNVAGAQSKDWQAEWERIVKAAKAEKEVAVGCEPPMDSQNALMEFSKAYPDIQLK